MEISSTTNEINLRQYTISLSGHCYKSFILVSFFVTAHFCRKKIKSRRKPLRKNINSFFLRRRICRSSYLQIFLKKGVLKIFAIFTEKPFVKASFNTVAGLQAYACNSIKKRIQIRRFLVNIAKFLRTAFSIEQLWWLLLQ